MSTIQKIFVGLFAAVAAVAVFAVPAFAATSGPVNPYAFRAVPGSQSGTVVVSWYDDATSQSYDLSYGTSSSSMPYGVIAMPDTAQTTNSFTVGDLQPGTTYYFTLTGQTSAAPNISGPIMAVAAGKPGKPVMNAPQSTASTVAQASTSAFSGPTSQYQFLAQPGTTTGTIDLKWIDDGSANKYDIVYGLMPGQYSWGLENMPFTPLTGNTYTVGYLTKGTRYYFALVSENNGNPVVWSDPISAVAK